MPGQHRLGPFRFAEGGPPLRFALTRVRRDDRVRSKRAS